MISKQMAWQENALKKSKDFRTNKALNSQNDAPGFT